MEKSGKVAKIEEIYGPCYSSTVGTLFEEKSIQRDENGNVYPDGGKCSPRHLGRNNPDFGDMVFRWRIAKKNGNVLDHLTDIQAPTNSDSPTANSADPGAGLGISTDGFVFPLKTTKSHITNRDENKRWCYQNQTSCHHDYKAADIMADPGTPVVAAKKGKVIFGHNNPTGPACGGESKGSTGSDIAILGEDKNVYWYGHLKSGSVKFTGGEEVEAGTEIGQVGEDSDAQCTASHLHIDVQPPPATTRNGCTDADCNKPPFKFLDVQPALVKAFASLPE